MMYSNIGLSFHETVPLRGAFHAEGVDSAMQRLLLTSPGWKPIEIKRGERKEETLRERKKMKKREKLEMV